MYKQNDDFNMVRAQPFIKWVGGKRQLLKELKYALPEFENYHEPFLGGGALFFELSNLNLINQAYLYDYNEELVTAYLVIQNKPLELMEELQKPIYKNEQDTFQRMRALKPKDNISIAAKLLYLNRTSFNGLYRVNSKGMFNVPFGSYKNPKFFSRGVILAANKVLQKAKIHSADFSKVLEYAKEGDLVYFDPPYNPLSKTSSFTSYTSTDFGEKEQERLAQVFNKLDKRGCHVMLSNSSTELMAALYASYNIETVYANRAINCKADGRGKVAELIIRNWKPKQRQVQLVEQVIASTKGA